MSKVDPRAERVKTINFACDLTCSKVGNTLFIERSFPVNYFLIKKGCMRKSLEGIIKMAE